MIVLSFFKFFSFSYPVLLSFVLPLALLGSPFSNFLSFRFYDFFISSNVSHFTSYNNNTDQRRSEEKKNTKHPCPHHSLTKNPTKIPNNKTAGIQWNEPTYLHLECDRILYRHLYRRSFRGKFSFTEWRTVRCWGPYG